MYRILLFIFSLILSFSLVSLRTENDPKETRLPLKTWNQHIYSTYACLADTTLSFEAFDFALRGYYALLEKGELENEKYLTVIDFTQHSSAKRLYVIDTEDFRIVHKTYCSHGKNTGGEMATSFSNRSGSLQSSLGFYIASETYSGKFDYAMRLDGMEYSNSNARDRGIVMHGADYATPAFLSKNDNVLGRSFGCPSVPKKEATTIINMIKGGSCLFIYADQSDYERRSRLIQPDYFLKKVVDLI